jgi:hypothetical protein
MVWVQIVIAVVVSIISYVLAPKAGDQGRGPASLSGFDVPTATEDRAIPIIFGRRLMESPNVVWYGNLKSYPIKKKKQTVGHHYFLDMHHILASNTISRFHRILIGDKLAWGTGSSGTQPNFGPSVEPRSLSIYQPFLFGGEDSEGGIAGGLKVYFGLEDQAPIGGVGVAGGGVAFLGITSVVLKFMNVGTSPYIKYWAYDIEANFEPGESDGEGGYSTEFLSPFAIRTLEFFDNLESSKVNAWGDMNPIFLIYALIANEDFGLGYADSDIDRDAFKYAAEVLDNDGFGLSFQWMSEMSVEEFLKEIVRHLDAAIYVHPLTGLFTVKLMRYDYDINTLKHFDESNIVDINKYNRPAIGETCNEVTVTYIEGKTGKKRPVNRKDAALFDRQGYAVASTIDLPGVSNRQLADKICQSKLHSLGAPVAAVEIVTNRDAAEIGIGEVITWSWESLEVDHMVLRVLDITYGSSQNNAITLTCVQDIFSLDVYSLDNSIDEDWEIPSEVPQDILDDNVITMEAPYATIIPKGAPANYVPNPEDAVILMHLAIANAGTLGIELQSRIPLIEEEFTPEVDEGDSTPYGYLLYPLKHTDTILYYSSFENIDSMKVKNYLLIDGEFMRITKKQKNLNRIFVQRGLFDTRPRRHLAGSRIVGYSTAFAMVDDYDEEFYEVGDVVEYRFIPTTSQGPLDESEAEIRSVTCVGRQVLPYAPGLPKLNGGIDWDDIFYDLDPRMIFDWVTRGRLKQGKKAVHNAITTNYAIEAGTTYTACVKDQLNLNVLGALPAPSALEISGGYSADIFAVVGDIDIPVLNLSVGTERDGYANFQDVETLISLFPNDPTDLYMQTLMYAEPFLAFWRLTDNTVGSLSMDATHRGYTPHARDYSGGIARNAFYVGNPSMRDAQMGFLDDMRARPYFDANQGLFLNNIPLEFYEELQRIGISLWVKRETSVDPAKRQHILNVVDTLGGVCISVFILGGQIYVEHYGTNLDTGTTYLVDGTPTYIDFNFNLKENQFPVLSVAGSVPYYCSNNTILADNTTVAYIMIGGSIIDVDSAALGHVADSAMYLGFRADGWQASLVSCHMSPEPGLEATGYEDTLDAMSPVLWNLLDNKSVVNGLSLPAHGLSSITGVVHNGPGLVSAFSDRDNFSKYVSEGRSITQGQNWYGTIDGLAPVSSRIRYAHNELKNDLAELGQAGGTPTPFSIIIFARHCDLTELTPSGYDHIPSAPLFYLGNGTAGATKVTAAFGINEIATGDRRLVFACLKSGSDYLTQGTTNLCDRLFRMYVATVDPVAEEVRIYVDGELEAVGVYPSGGISIGSGNDVFSSCGGVEETSIADDPLCWWNGQLSNIAVVPTALTPGDVVSLYQVACTGSQNKLLAYPISPIIEASVTNLGYARKSSVGGNGFVAVQSAIHAPSNANIFFELEASQRSGVDSANDESIVLSFGTMIKEQLDELRVGNTESSTYSVSLKGRTRYNGVQGGVIDNVAIVDGEFMQLIYLGKEGIILARRGETTPTIPLIPVVLDPAVSLPARNLRAGMGFHEIPNASILNTGCSASFDAPNGTRSLDGTVFGEIDQPAGRVTHDPAYTFNGSKFLFNDTYFFVDPISGYGNGYLSQGRTSPDATKYAFEFRQTALAALDVFTGICTQRSSSGTVQIGDTGNGFGVTGLTGKLYYDGAVDDLGPVLPNDEWCMFIVDFTAKTITLISDTLGTFVGTYTSDMPAGTYYPGFSSNQLNGAVEFNMGDRPFVNTLPTGIHSWDDSQIGA